MSLLPLLAAEESSATPRWHAFSAESALSSTHRRSWSSLDLPLPHKAHSKDGEDYCCGGVSRKAYDFTPTWLDEARWQGRCRRLVFRVVGSKMIICLHPRPWKLSVSRSFHHGTTLDSHRTSRNMTPVADSAFHTVLICDSPYAEGKDGIRVLGLASLVLAVLFLLGQFLRLFAVGARYFFADGWLTFEFCVVVMCLTVDLVIVFAVTPFLRHSNMKPHAEAVWDYQHWPLYIIRMGCVSLLWRIVRWLRDEEDPCVYVFHSLEAVNVMKNEFGGMPEANILSVQVIKPSPSERAIYQSKLKAMRQQYGFAREQSFFFGTSKTTPRKLLTDVSVLGARDSSDERMGKFFCVAERAVHVDACTAYTDWASDPTGRTRQLFMVRALVSNAPSMPNDAHKQPARTAVLSGSLSDSNCAQEGPSDPADLQPARNTVFSGSLWESNCTKGGPWDPLDYLPEKLALQRRDVESVLHVFRDPWGQVTPIALVTYQNPDTFEEIAKLQESGVRTWSEYAGRVRDGVVLEPGQALALEELGRAIDKGDKEKLSLAMQACRTEKVAEGDIRSVKSSKKKDSQDAGISLAYLLSAEFERMACQATNMVDPTFLDMKEPFFLGNKPIGHGRLCPRDLRPGCAFIDTLSPNHRRKATHFVSWVWGYKLGVVRDCLRRWSQRKKLLPEEVFLYMCFFCNNQWRILREQAGHGSQDLESVFGARLKSIGNVVALMDTWQNPAYTKRIWTIYEQHVIIRLGIRMQFSLPTAPADALIAEVTKGKDGIRRVIEAVSKVNAKEAKASVPEDERKVKALIENSPGGFAQVDREVKGSISTWIAKEFKDWIDSEIGKH